MLINTDIDEKTTEISQHRVYILATMICSVGSFALLLLYTITIPAVKWIIGRLTGGAQKQSARNTDMDSEGTVLTNSVCLMEQMSKDDNHTFLTEPRHTLCRRSSI